MQLFGRKKRWIQRVLVVEDEPLIAFETEYFLRDEGFRIVATVDSVADALHVLRHAPLHLVLVDMTLVDGSGTHVAREAKARGVEALIVTGQDPGDITGLAAGCLFKPYHPRDLISAIDAIDAVRSGDIPRRMPSQFRLFAGAA